jgi:hypothetical protein
LARLVKGANCWPNDRPFFSLRTACQEEVAPQMRCELVVVASLPAARSVGSRLAGTSDATLTDLNGGPGLVSRLLNARVRTRVGFAHPAAAARDKQKPSRTSSRPNRLLTLHLADWNGPKQ